MIDYTNLCSILKDKLFFMKKFKNKKKSKEEFVKDILFLDENGIDLNNKEFQNMLDIAWKFCEQENNKAINELDNYLNELLKKNSKAVVLEKVLIVYQLLNKTAKEKFNENKNEYLTSFKLIAVKKTSSFNQSFEHEKLIDLVPIEKKIDKFGHWELDRLFGHLKLYLVIQNSHYEYEDFPFLWKTDKEKTVFEIKEIKETDSLFKEIKINNLALKEHIQRELKIYENKQLEQILSTLNNKSIYTVYDLTKINDWTDIERCLPAQFRELKNSISNMSNFNKQNSSSFKQKKTEAELLGDWNKVELYLFYESGMTNINSLGKLNAKALKQGFEEQRNDPDFDGGHIINEIEEILTDFTLPNLPLRKHSHGMILYGPPGTGKTQLCSVVINKSGLFGLVPPLSSSELNRSKVGETEQLLIDIFYRAYQIPYLLCCIAIDEIDALTPKRNEKTGEHKVDVLCLLLSLIGGIKDVKNVFVIASTNRLNKIDEAFARRLQNKLYVGRLDVKQRIDLIFKINDPINKLPAQFKYLFEPTNLSFEKLLTILTNNFTGAAMAALRSQLLFYFDKNAKSDNSRLKFEKDFKKLCSKVANDFQIKIGGFSIPDLFLKEINLDNLTRNLRNKLDDEKMNLTGRVLIDLRSDILNIQFEKLDGSLKEILFFSKNKPDESLLNEEPQFTADIVPILLVFSQLFKIPYFQLIDSNLMLTNSAFDENTTIEAILEKLNEYEQYKNAMIVFDADTLVGISESLSNSFGESVSYTIQNSRVWQQIILHNFKAEFSNKKSVDHRWCFIVSSSEFLINQFKKVTKFEYCKSEHDFMIRERECKNCGLKFTNKENQNDSCSYHPKTNLKKLDKVGNETFQIFKTRKEIHLMAQKYGRDIFNDFFYECCFRRADESDGCKKDFHKEGIYK